MNEFSIIKKYFSNLSKNNKGSFDLSDDIFFDYKKKVGISIDNYVEGTHFLNFKNPNLVIKKCLRGAISDLICKGIVPKYYFISCSGHKKHFTQLLGVRKSWNELITNILAPFDGIKKCIIKVQSYEPVWSIRT